MGTYPTVPSMTCVLAPRGWDSTLPAVLDFPQGSSQWSPAVGPADPYLIGRGTAHSALARRNANETARLLDLPSAMTDTMP